MDYSFNLPVQIKNHNGFEAADCNLVIVWSVYLWTAQMFNIRVYVLSKENYLLSFLKMKKQDCIYVFASGPVLGNSHFVFVKKDLMGKDLNLLSF